MHRRWALIGGVAGISGTVILVWILGAELEQRHEVLPRPELGRVLRQLEPRVASPGRAPASGRRRPSREQHRRDAVHLEIVRQTFEEDGLRTWFEDRLRRHGLDAPRVTRVIDDLQSAIASVRAAWQSEVDKGSAGHPMLLAQGDLFFAMLPEMAAHVEHGGGRVDVALETSGSPRATFRVEPLRRRLVLDVHTRNARLAIVIATDAAPRGLDLALRESYAPLLAALAQPREAR